MTLVRRASFAACVAGSPLLLGAGTAGASPFELAPATGSVVATGWSSGYCTTDTGVTVIADFTDLDQSGDGRPDYGIVARCVPGPVQTGVAALQQAGLSPAGTRQYGLAFICRIANRPAADEPLAVKGNAGYTEQCDQTPPDAAHWEYWTASNGGMWAYSSVGAGSRRPVAGGFEGWSFSLNNSHHPPGVAPNRPTASPPPTTRPTPTDSPSAAPTSPSPHPPAPHRPAPHRPSPPGNGRPAVGGPPSVTHAEHTARPAPPSPSSPSLAPTPEPAPLTSAAPHRLRRQSSWVPQARGAQRTRASVRSQTTGAEPASPSTATSGVLPHGGSAGQSAGSPVATLAGLGFLGLLAAGAGITAWRRSRRV